MSNSESIAKALRQARSDVPADIGNLIESYQFADAFLQIFYRNILGYFMHLRLIPYDGIYKELLPTFTNSIGFSFAHFLSHYHKYITETGISNDDDFDEENFDEEDINDDEESMTSFLNHVIYELGNEISPRFDHITDEGDWGNTIDKLITLLTQQGRREGYLTATESLDEYLWNHSKKGKLILNDKQIKSVIKDMDITSYSNNALRVIAHSLNLPTNGNGRTVEARIYGYLGRYGKLTTDEQRSLAIERNLEILTMPEDDTEGNDDTGSDDNESTEKYQEYEKYYDNEYLISILSHYDQEHLETRLGPISICPKENKRSCKKEVVRRRG